ncbi:phosphatase PAP2 family protein [Rhodococcus opacus]|nr:phosphatase PAP2 family protein [Rhodococcus opacus]
MTTHALAFDGSGIDGSAYLDTTNLARQTHWINGLMSAYSSYGIAVVAYLVNDGIKGASPRNVPATPTRRRPARKTLTPTDYSFPSNHTVVAAAMAAALLLDSNPGGRRLGIVAAVAALLIGLSRVYVGAHYPHDVAAALVVGVVVGPATAVTLRKDATPVVAKLSTGPLRPVLTGTATQNSAR